MNALKLIYEYGLFSVIVTLTFVYAHVNMLVLCFTELESFGMQCMHLYLFYD